MTPEPAIHLERAGKAYDLVTAAGNIFTRYVASRAHSAFSAEEFWALRGIDLDVAPGTMLGVIGVNGSGKSTLLKLIAGIADPTEGTVTTRGRVVTMLEVGMGFHDDLTGYENVYLQGAVLGLGKRQLDQRVSEIIGFAGLNGFMEMPVKHFSTGMRARLGFAISIHSDPDIVLVDEVLAVGDGAFQMKCVEAMRALHAAGKTIVFVTHHIRHAAKLCDRIAWIDGGTLRLLGESAEVARAYRQALCERAMGHTEVEGGPRGELARVHLVETVSTAPACFRHGEHFAMRVEGVTHEPIDQPDLRVLITREDYEIVAATSARACGCLPERIEGEFAWIMRWPNLFLNTGTYTIGLVLVDEVGCTVASKSDALQFHVEAPHMIDPEVLADLPCTFEMR